MSTGELIAYLVGAIGGSKFIFDWWLKKDKQEAEISGDIALKYALRITALETKVDELTKNLLDRVGEVGELRGRVAVLTSNLQEAQKDRDALHMEVSRLQGMVTAKT